MSDFDTIARKSAKDAKKEKDKRQNNKQHCTKISQGLDDFDKSSADRAIWELVQNARDLSNNCKIEIALNNDYFIFSHNGAPFTPDTLGSLVKQVSSEEKEDPNKVGQYGTGFITTHLFGRIIMIDGSFQLDPDNNPEYFVDLNDFTIDRTFDEIDEFVKKLCNQLDEIDKLMDNPVTTSCREMTRLKYKLSDNTFKENAKTAINNGIKLVPYVIALNPNIKEFIIKDDLSDIHISFTQKEPSNENGLEYIPIEIIDFKNVEMNRIENIYYLSNTKRNIKVILPLVNSSNTKDIGEIPKIFLFFPLLGTENWGVNYIIHSEDFIPLEARNGLFLAEENPNTIKKEENNKKLINEASILVFDYLKDNIQNLSKTINIAKIQFNTNTNKEDLSKYYLELQKEWTQIFEELPMIPTSEGYLSIKNSNNFLVFDSQIVETVSKMDEDFLNTVYKYATKNYILPNPDEIIEWSNIIYNWYEKDIEDYVCNIENIVKNNDDWTDSELHNFLLFIKESGNKDLFDKYPLIPNREGELKLKEDLVYAETITDELYELVKTIVPDSTNKFLDPKYSDIAVYGTYTRDDLKNSLSAKISEEKRCFQNNKTLSVAFENPLLKFCCSFSTKGSSSLRRNIMPIFCELLQQPFEEIIISSITSDENLHELAFNTIVEDLFLQIALKERDWIQNNFEKLVIIHENFSQSKTHIDLIKKYSIFPSENLSLHITSELKIEDNIHEDLKEFYNKLFTEKNIQDYLLHQEIKAFYSPDNEKRVFEFETLKGETVAKQIDDKLAEDGYKNNITLDIIKKLDNDELKNLFKNIDKNKASIFIERIDENKKSSVYELMKIDDKETLDCFAELSKNPRIRSILAKASDIIWKEDNQKADFEFKYEIGTRIEKLIKERLTEEIDTNSLYLDKPTYDETREIGVENIQNGQDIIVYFKEVPVYYIEIKSKWNFLEPAHMSKNQMIAAIKYANKYSLCCVDLSEIENIEERHYPQIDTIINNIYIHNEIGNDLKPLLSGVIDADNDESENRIKIDGDYRASIRKKYFTSGSDFDSLITTIYNEIISI